MMDWETLLNPNRVRQSTLSGQKDPRAEFERDFDRSVFSTPVKRMQDKAQVFPLDPCDAVRTRLTHSLEVSSVARGLGTAVGKWLLEKKVIEPGMDRAIEAITATCGLIHDLGNPPFGHAGEDAIRVWFKRTFSDGGLNELLEGQKQLIADFQNFEGNAQSLRLVGKLQILADFNGLNLTFGTLSASCKYTASSDTVDPDIHAMSKPGHFASENELVKKIRDASGTGDARNPLTFLVEAADDIVYSVADIEDGVKKGIITWSDLKSQLKSNTDTVVENVLNLQETILKAGEKEEPPDLPDDTYASAFRTAAIAIAVPSVVNVFKEKYSEIMAGKYAGELVADCNASSLVSQLKAIGRSRVYCTPSTLKLELMGRRVIGDLMDIFWEGAKYLPVDKPPKTKNFEGKAAALLSENYCRVFKYSVSEKKFPEAYHRLQLVTDYVCGMTDSFAKRLHAELMNGD